MSGAPGARGAAGANGAAGISGAPGARGAAGAYRAAGISGAPGASSAAGANRAAGPGGSARRGRGAGAAAAPAAALPVLVREVVEPRWPYWRPPLGSLDGLTRRRANGVLRLLHVDGAPVVVAISGRVFAARAASEEAAREGIARMKFAAGVDDDLAEFHERFRDDPVIGRAVRARPWVRVRRNPTPWETLAWAITEQLITMERAVGIQKAIVRAYGPRHGQLRDSPDAATIAARAPAELDACGLHPKRSLAMIRAARTGSFDERRLLAIRDIGTWTIEMLALHGFGRLDVIPAGDLGYLKLVGRLTTGNPRAIADEAEVRGFMAPYAPWAGMAAQYLSRATRSPAPRRAGTRWSAAAPPTAAA